LFTCYKHACLLPNFLQWPSLYVLINDVIVSINLKKSFIRLGVLLFFVLSLTIATAQAQDVNNSGLKRAIAISPLTFELTASPGDVIQNKIKVSNPGNTPILVSMEAEDFSAVGETGSVVVQEQNNDTFSLASWVTLSERKFTLAPKETKIVDFTITIPLDGEPGGHYGSILSAASPPDFVAGSGISQKVGALVLLSVAGDVRETLQVKEFSAPAFLEKPPVDFLLRFVNIGTVHIRPRGFISITNMFGKKEVDLAFPQRNVLPGSIRKINVKWDPEFAIGKYTATLVANYGTYNSPLAAVVSFWVFPWKIVLLIFIIIIIVLMILIRSRRRLRLALRVLIKGEKK